MKIWPFLGSVLLVAAPAVHAAHPLVTEDTGTQGAGGWQLEANVERFSDTGFRATTASATISYGIADNVDLQAGSFYADSNFSTGYGDTALSVKWRPWEKDGLSFGLKPTITLPTGQDEKGVGTGRAGWGGLAILTYETGRWAFHTHAGYFRVRNVQGFREPQKQVAAAALYRATERLRPLLDYSRTTFHDDLGFRAAHSTTVGIIYSPNKDLDLDVGLRHGGGATVERALLAGITLRW